MRICTNPEKRDNRLSDLKELLLARKYPESLVDRSIEKARKIPRKIALLKVRKKESEVRPIFAIKYDPRMPPIQPLMAKHWRAMKTQDKYLAECFSQPPLTAFRRQTNIRDFLIKSKIAPPPKQYPGRNNRGMANCGKTCTACPYIQYRKEIKVDSKSTWKIMKKMSCLTYNIVYMLECQKNNCKQRYIGSTGRELKHRLADHRGYIQNQVTSRATGAHWNLPGHSLADLRVSVLEQCKKKSRIRETKNLSTDADRRTDTILERLSDLFKKK